MQQGNIELRRFLQELTSGAVRRTPEEHERQIAEIRSRSPHSIRSVQRRVFEDVRTWRFNCHAYALGLSRCEPFWQLQEINTDAWPNARFVRTLLPSLEPDVANSASEHLVLYRDASGRLTHSGIARAGAIYSKWGDGNTWAHDVFEVPLSYGSVIERFAMPQVDAVLASYLTFFGSPKPQSG